MEVLIVMRVVMIDLYDPGIRAVVSRTHYLERLFVSYNGNAALDLSSEDISFSFVASVMELYDEILNGNVLVYLSCSRIEFFELDNAVSVAAVELGRGGCRSVELG